MALNGMAQFTQRARRVLSWAQGEAGRMNQAEIGTEHLLLGLLLEEEGVAAMVLRDFGLDIQRGETLAAALRKPDARAFDGVFDLTDGTKRVIEQTVDEARRMGHRYIGTEHLLLGLVVADDETAKALLAELNVTADDVCQKCAQVMAKLTKFSKNRGDFGVGFAKPDPDVPPDA